MFLLFQVSVKYSMQVVSYCFSENQEVSLFSNNVVLKLNFPSCTMYKLIDSVFNYGKDNCRFCRDRIPLEAC